MSILISTYLFHFGVADDSSHYFTLPEGCSNDGGKFIYPYFQT